MFGTKICAVACLAVACSIGACGGTSSETPWPVEPIGPAVGPSGETMPPGAADDLEGQVVVPEETEDANPNGGQ